MNNLFKRIVLFTVALGTVGLAVPNSIGIVAANSAKPQYYYVEKDDIELVNLSQPIEINVSLADGINNTTKLPKQESYGYTADTLRLGERAELQYEFSLEMEGYYNIDVDYYIPESRINNLSLDLKINGEYPYSDCNNVILQSIWKDATQEYITDANGNEIYPRPEMISKWQTKSINNLQYNSAKPYAFYFKKGKNTIDIKSNDVPAILGTMKLTGKKEGKTAEQYFKEVGTATEMSKSIVIQGEAYTTKNESFVRGNKGTDYNSYPYDPSKKLIQNLSGNMWGGPGDGMSYTFEALQEGIYYITLKCKNLKKDMPIFTQIKIDGEYLFDEMKAYAFPYTGAKYVNHTITIEDKPVPVYLAKGEHTLSFASTAEPLSASYENLREVISLLNDTALEIKVITGNRSDKNRDWEIEEYIPNLSSRLIESAEIIEKEYELLNSIASKDNVALISNLMVAAMRLRDFSKDLNYLVNNLDQLVQSNNSATEYVSLILDDLLDQGLSIDCIYVNANIDELPKPRLGFFKTLGQETTRLGYSFVTDKNDSSTVSDEAINVWANRSVYHLDIMKEMAINFENETGKRVELSLMPDEQKLLLAVSAGAAPDVVVGSTSYRPFDFALRDAVYDLRQFDDFPEVIDWFEPEMFVPFTIGDSCYGIPETANFQLLFYRKDIMKSLNLEVPNTWDDVIEMLPTLSRFGMQFNTMIANIGAKKHFGATVPFIQQFGGKIYSEDGSKVELGDPKTVEAFTLMTDLYTKYSLPENIPIFFNDFKRGTAPIGMGDINTYILLRHTAPELTGQWGIAPSIGVESESGEILRYQPSVNTVNLILKSAKDTEGSWDFLKWWMSEETQVDFANQLRLRFGPTYIWNTANVGALAKSNSFTEEDKAVILEQLSYTKEIPRNPAYFAVERELSNAWNATVFDGLSPRTALDSAITKSNREITKKLKEFGYVAEDGTLIKPFDMATAETVLSWKEPN